MTNPLRPAEADLGQLRRGFVRLLKDRGPEPEDTAAVKDSVDALSHDGLAKYSPEAVEYRIERVAKEGGDLLGIPAHPGIFLDDGADQQVRVAGDGRRPEGHGIVRHHLPRSGMDLGDEPLGTAFHLGLPRLAASKLADDLDVPARQVLQILRSLFARTVAARARLPDSLAADAAVLGLGDLDQGLPGDGIDGVVVRVKAEDEAHRPGLLVEQGVGLVHRRHPAAGNALMRPIAVAGLV